MDNLTKTQRRKNMQNIRSFNTAPELRVFKELRRIGISFVRHAKSVYGRPDIIIRKRKLAVFIDSDFWHGHPTRCVMPKSNRKYWNNKIKRNRERDKEVNRKLRLLGWKVIRIWEHNVKKRFKRSISKITRSIGR